ncbi:hypothetical protein L9S41_09880 [Geoalkalibacter halelectricus]|uniref:Uncharacterized protein n=2 Tax=Geoalkalibacter halelectricus TaxID=2847045 RepID=A0ABY5ZJQ6_9BACT|nr:hypothetical protein [Geoalkalibacter halelectricus]UWZ78010.1 hypothetical protein L9S41_09880 [Geoalkalibacter halelectricus]
MRQSATKNHSPIQKTTKIRAKKTALIRIPPCACRQNAVRGQRKRCKAGSEFSRLARQKLRYLLAPEFSKRWRRKKNKKMLYKKNNQKTNTSILVKNKKIKNKNNF